MHPEFNALTTTAGLEIIDPIETRRFALRTTAPVEPTPAATEEFEFPVDTACEILADGVVLSHTVPVTVRTRDGTHRETISPTTSREFPAGEHLVELDAPIKLYVRVDSSLTVEANTDTVEFDFGEQVAVRVGARSYHSSPAGTITVPDDPEAMMEAVSALSSSLKTTSPERSWPTLRGHPPRIERGDELAIPEGLDSPDTGITIEVPPEYGPIYAVAPLAYYLGADVIPGETARLRADGEVVRHLGEGRDGIGVTAGEILKRVLLLDCVTRTEGYYSIELHEREVLERQVNPDFEALYDATPGERLAAYLAVPDEAVDSIVPTWHRVAHVQPTPDSVEALPYVVNDLSVVHVQSPSDEEWTATDGQRATENAIKSFVRAPASGDDFVRSAGTRSRASDESDGEITATERGVPGIGEYVPLPDVDALEQAYVGDKTPECGTKLLPEAFENDVPELTEGVIEITVVCNDEQMREEWDAVSEIYGDRDDVYVDVDCRFGVSTDELRDLLARNHDVFHFIGHIDGLGFECPDGILDAKTVEETGATTVLLNGCRSHDQGIALIEAGANAGIVSLGDVGNDGAIEVGETLASLLQYGLSVGSAMELVAEYTSIGHNYLVVGNPNTEVAQCDTGMPIVYRVEEDLKDSKNANIRGLAYPTKLHAVGALFHMYFHNSDINYLALGFTPKVTVDWDEFRNVLTEYSQPLVIDGELVRSDLWLEGI